MKKKTFGIMLAVVAMICMVFANTLTASAYIVHEHLDATGATVSFTPIHNLTELKNLFATGGSGYLSADITADGALTVNVADVNLCLNNKVLNLNGAGNIKISNGVKFALYDCGNTTRYYDKNSKGLWKLKESGTSDRSTVGGVITGGVAEDGGAFYVNGATLTMYGGNICGNLASKVTSEAAYGGGVGVAGGGTFTMLDGTICGNISSIRGFGGGIGVQKGTLIIKKGTIHENTGYFGGGVLTYLNASLSIENATISNNTATEGAGGGVNMRDGNNIIKNTQITGNTTGSHGGGVYVVNEIDGVKTTLLKMENLTINGNTAAKYGGGVYASTNSVVGMRKCTISGNTAKTGGGMQSHKTAKIFMNGDNGNEISITGNTASDAIGGFANWGELHLSGQITIKNNLCANTYSGTNYPANLATGKPIQMDGELNDSEIYVTHASAEEDLQNQHDGGFLTQGYTEKNPGAGLDTFFRYEGPFLFRMNNGELEVYNPNTGDANGMGLAITLLVLATIGFSVCLGLRKNDR